MVSLFGLKLGGDKKKKIDKGLPSPSSRSRAQSRAGHDASAFDEPLPTVPRGLFSSSSRPGSSQSQKLFSRKSKFFPYGSGANGALSMANLPRPGDADESPLPSPAFLRPTTSNPNLNSRFKGGSTTDLTASARPMVPPPSLDVLSAARNGSVTAFASPKSPLGTYELTLNLPSEGVSLFGDVYDILKPPEPLRIKKQEPAPSQAVDLNLHVTKPPSPPVSVVTTPSADGPSGPDRPSRSCQESLERTLRRVDSNQTYGSRKEIESPIDPAPVEPFPLPTPPLSVARNSDDRPSTGASNQWGEPVIQNVRGKRDTMVVKPTRRMSFEKYVEDFSRDILPLPSEQSPPQIPPMSSKRAVRPPPLNLNVRSDLVVQAAPRSAPLGLSQRPLLAQPDSSRRPAMVAPPLSAGGPFRQPARPDVGKISRPSADEYGCFPHDDMDELDDEDRPPTPDSPLLPLSGPLASPLIRADVQEEPEDPLERLRNFRFPAMPPSKNTATSNTLVPRYKAASPVRESFHTAESFLTTEWPLPSPIQAPIAAFEPAPQPVNAQPEQQIRSFSRPWTPRKENAPMTLHDSPDSLDSLAARPHIASQASTGVSARNPVVDGFDNKGGGFF